MRVESANEVRVIGVGEPVGALAGLGHDRTLLEHEHCLGSSHEREQRLDRLPALRVGDCVTLPRGDRELDAFVVGEIGEQRSGLARSGAQLEMRRAAE